MTDEFGEGCDERTPAKYDSSLVEDPIDIIDKVTGAGKYRTADMAFSKRSC